MSCPRRTKCKRNISSPLHRAQEAWPWYAMAYNGIGSTENLVALYELENERDPRDALRTGQAMVVRALELDATFLYSYATLAIGWARQARYETRAGIDPKD